MVNNNLMFVFSYLFNLNIFRLRPNYIKTRGNRFLGHLRTNISSMKNPNIREANTFQYQNSTSGSNKFLEDIVGADNSDQNNELTL